MMFWYGNGMGGWGYVLMTVGMVLFWGLLIFGVVALVRVLGRGSQHTAVPAAQRAAPERILADRYARGEIDEDEYHRRLDTLLGRTGRGSES
ncbi:SHOCT domain-containing protein [Amycolatopsis sp. NPDC021455]|uniref:SHOCT domain-containing protein n=1 Tax=Amycolatopsis sp. NPDC021455 TaxID=3154901 RepID=UPI0033C0C7FA